jgi:hypothetical protein
MDQERFIFIDDKDRTPEFNRGSLIVGLFITGVSALGLILLATRGEFDTGFPGDWNMVLFFIVGAVYILRGYSKKLPEPRFVGFSQTSLLLKLSLTGKVRSIDFGAIRRVEHDNREFRIVTSKEVIPLPYSAFGYNDIQTMKKRFDLIAPEAADVA